RRRGDLLGPDRAGAGARPRRRRPDPGRRRAPRPEGRLPVPDVVRPLVDVPGEAFMSTVEAPNQEQLRAIEEPGVVFVSAGAGTGETTSERLRLLASYGGRRLRRMLTGVHETLRSSGLPLRLEAPGDSQLEARLGELRVAAEAIGQTQMLQYLDGSPGPEALLDLSDLRERAGEAEAYEEARHAVERAALEALAARDREQLQELLLAYDRAYRAAKDRESALDFEDLQLLARELLEQHQEIRERESWRFRSIMVDEFQDTNRLQCELVDLLARDDGELFFVGDEFQSIYRF